MDNKPDGNDFQFKVKRVLTDNGWSVRMSPHYNDIFSEKPREIDIIAEKAFPPASNSIYNSTVIVRLFVECKYISDSTIFWFDERNTAEAKKVIDSLRSFHDPENNTSVAQKHHYLAEKPIAKLFRTGSKTGADGDPMYKAINQCLNAYIYFRNHPTNLRENYDYQSVVEIDYPIIICNSFNLLQKKNMIVSGQDISTEQIQEPFQLEIDYAFTVKGDQREEFFYLDILSINDLKSFEDSVLLPEINLAKQKAHDDYREAQYYRRQEQNSDNFDPFSLF